MNKIDELWQAYDENCKPVLGIGLTREEAYTGKLHAASQVWLWRHNGAIIEVLLQLRASDKKTWPSHWDISAAGHVDLSETPEKAAIREAAEELSLNVENEKLSPIFTYHANYVDQGSGSIENEWQFVFGFQVTTNIGFKFDDGEVAEVKWLSLDEFINATESNSEIIAKLVPHGDEYYSQLIQYLKQKL